MSLKLSSKTLTGSLQNLNKWACDWGWQGFVAYGTQNLVTVVDPKTVQVIQNLDKHKGYVVKVKWAKENYHHDLASPYTLRLASADFNGKVIVWNVGQGAITSEFSDGSKPVADMEWLRSQDASQDLLAVLHPPYSLVLWNAITGTKLWKKSYTEVLQSFTFDPFDPSKLAFLGQDCILFVDDFSQSKTPSSNGRKYYISSPNSQGTMNNSSSAEKIGEKKTTKSTIKIVSSMLVGDGNKSKSQVDESVAVNDCLQLVYHPACRHHLIMLYARELLVLDLEINQTVGIIPMDRNGSPFVQVMPMRQRDVLMCLHENGAVTARVRRKPKEVPQPQIVGEFEDLSPQSQGLNYDLKSQSDAMRLTRHVRVYGTCYCPVSENKVSVLLSDGRVLFWELATVDFKVKQSPQTSMSQSPLFTPGTTLPPDLGSIADSRLNLSSTVTPPRSGLSDLLGQMTLSQSYVSQKTTPDGGVQEKASRHEVSLKFILKGLLSGVASPPYIVKMCPPLTTKNWTVYQPLLAVGTGTGHIQIFNVSGGFLTREFSIHTSAVKGVEWCSLQSFMSFTSSSPNSNGLVKNEIIITDVQTGRTTPIRANRDEESPIEMIKISYLKQYFVIVFKDKPFELWELKTGAMLRQMPRHFPKITALEWSPSHGTKTSKKKSQMDSISFSGSSMDLSATTPSGEAPSGFGSSKLGENSSPVKEHFVFTDTEGLLYHFIIEGNMVKDGSKIPPDGSMSQISSLAWKGDTLVLGDIDGNLNVWDLKQRISKAIPTHKGWIKKMKYAPGRGNMKVLVVHNDGADIWDAKNCEMISSLRTPKDLPKISDADWVASDKPAFACADGSIRILDVSLQYGCSSLSEYQLQDPVFSPYLIPPKAAQSLKCHLQHQNWNDGYALCIEETEDNSDIFQVVNEQLQLIDSDVKAYLCESPFGTAQRCLTTAKLFGDESDTNFWTLALHYLRQEKADPNSKKLPRSQSTTASGGNIFIPSTPARESATDLVNLESPKTIREKKTWQFVKDSPLETCYDTLCDNDTFQKYQLDRISLHDQKRSTYEHTRKCAENLMLLGQADRAVQLLLETEAGNDSYYVDSLRACLVASIRSSGASQSTIKLVATNLIANGKLSEGVQLLCLIDKGLDACRYLQTYGEWYQSAWLAKATLDYPECCEVMKRWADHLNTPQVNQKTSALLVMLSLCQFSRVIEMLYSLRQFDRAALFIESCKEFELLPTSDELSSLVEAVFLEYSRFLLNLGNRKGAEYYCKQAGEKGKQLLQEIVAAFSP